MRLCCFVMGAEDVAADDDDGPEAEPEEMGTGMGRSESGTTNPAGGCR